MRSPDEPEEKVSQVPKVVARQRRDTFLELKDIWREAPP
jgi:hypothetical protein